MSYSAAIDNLSRLIPELFTTPGQPRRKFSLDEIGKLLAALGNPHHSFPSVLIAGTNGKGSTASTLASIARESGLRVGLYTSPHLDRVNERIRIGLPGANQSIREISDADFASLYFRVHDTAQQLVLDGKLDHLPSYFELLTAVAFLCFSAPAAGEAPVGLAILEVGMGGRLDATNIVDPILSVITDISLDHQDFLGHTITEIAREKAGILRPNGTLVTLPQHPEANQAIGEAAVALEVHAISAAPYIPHAPIPPIERHSERSEAESRNPRISPVASQIPTTSVELPRNQYTITLAGEPLHVDSPLLGQHQQRNLALAITAADVLRNYNSFNFTKSNTQSYKITNQQIEEGIRNTSWPGRLELLRSAKGVPLLLDVAHNPAGAWTLRAAIAQLPEQQPRTLIFSCLRDKDLREMTQILLPLFDSSSDRPQDHVLFAPIHNPRAASLNDLAAAAEAIGVPATAEPSIEAALAEARRVTPPNGIIIATGSIYLVGELRTLALSEANHNA
jgi:dihydrofolate synthase / folylpolyglutamate synthase